MDPQQLETQNKVIELLKRFAQEPDLLDDNWDKPLTGKKLRLTGTDMAYLFFELEKAFDIRIDAKHLSSYGFRSVNSILEIVKSYVKPAC